MSSQGLVDAKPQSAKSLRSWLVKGLIVACSFITALLIYYGRDEFKDAANHFWVLDWARPILVIGSVIVAANLAALVWQIYLFCAYRPVAPCGDEDLPPVTVIVPAYNEGRQVAEALRSVLKSDYPAGKLEVIAVDDGSRDDTWQWMQRVKAEAPERIVLIKQPRNMGKRYALYEGFKRGSGQLFVTIDSDSMVLSDTIRNLVSPLVRDSRTGAVAGNVRVLNRRQGIIPRMMEVSFTFSFDFMRAGQSRINTVICTPGALSAYRKDAVLPVLEGWVRQTFMGKPANIGEDRALTNLILENGYHILFQRNAVVYTEVPITYRNLCKMFLRWARSNVRECWGMRTFIFKNFRPTSKLGARINFILEAVNLTAMQLIKLVLLLFLAAHPSGVGVNMLFGALLGGGVLALFYVIMHRDSAALWGLPYGIYNLVILFWVDVYALCTPHNSGWLTRQIAAGGRPARSFGWNLRPAVQWAGAMALSITVGSSMALALGNPASPNPALALRQLTGPVAATVRHKGQTAWSFRAAALEAPFGLGPITLKGVEMITYRNGRLVSRVRADQAVLNPIKKKMVTFSGRVQMKPSRRATLPVATEARSASTSRS